MTNSEKKLVDNNKSDSQAIDSLGYDGNYLKILKAGNGDSFIIRFMGDDSVFKNILIDGGNKKSEFETYLKSEILEIQSRNEFIDLLIITHTDQDHVKGIQYLLNDSEIDNSIIKEVWFNSFDDSNFEDTNDISYTESCKIQQLLFEHNINRKNDITIDKCSEIIFFGAYITLLSPTKEDLKKLIIKNASDIASDGNDYVFSIDELISKNTKIFKDKLEDLDTTIENRVSIAFSIDINGRSLLFLGDANPDVVVNSIRRILKANGLEQLKVDILKMSHHASQKSYSLELAELIETNTFIVSANGKKSNLPNKLAFAKALNRTNKKTDKDVFLFNYDEVVENLNFTEDELEKYNYICLKPNYKNGYILKL